MTDPQDLIKQATTIHEAATPWSWRDMGDKVDSAKYLVARDILPQDVKFIVAARDLVPELAAALEQATRERDEARAELAKLKGKSNG